MSWSGQYGFPCVENPHDFTPDPSCCSPEEIACHKRALETWGTRDFVPRAKSHLTTDEEGNFVSHVLRSSWGIGTNTYKVCDGCQEPEMFQTTPYLTCHECGGNLDFCENCWPDHEKQHNDGDVDVLS